jgi:hypothetical protein
MRRHFRYPQMISIGFEKRLNPSLEEDPMDGFISAQV